MDYHARMFEVFGRTAPVFENLIYTHTDHLTKGFYTGGSWDYHHLTFDDKELFWAEPSGYRTWDLCSENYYEAKGVSGRTTGLIVSLFATNVLCWHFHEQQQEELMGLWSARYQALLDFAFETSGDEAVVIARAID